MDLQELAPIPEWGEDTLEVYEFFDIHLAGHAIFKLEMKVVVSCRRYRNDVSNHDYSSGAMATKGCCSWASRQFSASSFLCWTAHSTTQDTWGEMTVENGQIVDSNQSLLFCVANVKMWRRMIVVV